MELCFAEFNKIQVLLYVCDYLLISDIAVFVLKRDVKLQLTNL